MSYFESDKNAKHKYNKLFFKTVKPTFSWKRKGDEFINTTTESPIPLRKIFNN